MHHKLEMKLRQFQQVLEFHRNNSLTITNYNKYNWEKLFSYIVLFDDYQIIDNKETLS